MNYSILVTTFDKRFESYLMPLIDSIKYQRPEIEIIVTINGSCGANFNENYRSSVLAYLANQKNCFPTIFPNFQSLAKMWNRGSLTASNDQILILNDDVELKSGPEKCFFDFLENEISNRKCTFKINGSFSHFFLLKKDLIEVGFFDERLLGLGEEDGDFYWRYQEKFGKEIPSVSLDGIKNICSDIADSGYIKGIRTAAKFNRSFIKNVKYKKVFLGGYAGMFDQKVKKIIADEKQYPYEGFYRENIDKV